MASSTLEKDNGSIDVLSMYARKYFPGRPLDTDCLAETGFWNGITGKKWGNY